MKGYKGFNSDLTCMGFQYEEGKTYEIKENPELCERGFHFCVNPIDVLRYYSRDAVYHEITASGKIIQGPNKAVCSKITIGPRLDLFALVEKIYCSTYKRSFGRIVSLLDNSFAESGYYGICRTSDYGMSRSGDRGISIVHNNGVSYSGYYGISVANSEGIALTSTNGISVTRDHGISKSGDFGISIDQCGGSAISEFFGISISLLGSAKTGGMGIAISQYSLELKYRGLGIAIGTCKFKGEKDSTVVVLDDQYQYKTTISIDESMEDKWFIYNENELKEV